MIRVRSLILKLANQTPEIISYQIIAIFHRPHILIINTGLIEEQVLDSFIDATFIPTPLKPETKSLKPNLQPIKLNVSILDIWSSNEEERNPVDLWKDGKKTKT